MHSTACPPHLHAREAKRTRFARTMRATPLSTSSPHVAAHASAPWSNWSGSVRCEPRQCVRARDEADVVRVIGEAAASGRRVRVIGSGHSSSPLVGCTDILLDMTGVSGLVRIDAERRRATVRAGTTLQELGRLLYPHDLALPNYGDIAGQTVAGALATATHGSGTRQRALSSLLSAVRLVDGKGDVHDYGDNDSASMKSLRVALGVCGVFTEMTLQLVPTFDVQRQEFSARTDDALACFDALADSNYSFDMYWYPRRDDVKLRMVNPVGAGVRPPFQATLLDQTSGPGHAVIPTHSGILHRFEECEYAMPREAGLACFADVRKRMKCRWRHQVAWRVLLRTVAADDAHLSPHSERDSLTISLHQNASLPWRTFFEDIEPIFRAYGGRPHWAKKHFRSGATLSRLYPGWEDFHALRTLIDPHCTFMTPALCHLLGDHHGA